MSVCSHVQAEETRPRRQRVKKKEEAVVPCKNNRPAGNQRQEEPEAGQPLSPDCDDIQEMTSEGRSEQVWREEAVSLDRRMGFSHLAVKRKRQRRGTGLCTDKSPLHKSKPKGLLIFSHLKKDKERKMEEPPRSRPVFFFGGTNGAEIVSSYCESRGWRRIDNKDREDFRLMWCGTKSPTIYSHFREGQQLLYQIPNNSVLTTKIGLLSSLQVYERLSSQVKHSERRRRLKMEEFIPTTFRMDIRKERDTFFGLFKQQEGKSESRMWICKPSGLNQGKGILLLKNQEDVENFRLKLLQLEDNRKLPYLQNQPYVAQHYIHNPLLLKRRKFDVRSYLLIACTVPYMVFFRHGYVRLSCDIYDPKSKNLSTHLTNQKRMQQIMTQCFFAVKSKLDCRLGFFDLIGCDFLIDNDFKVWLLEMNCNPSLQTNCEVLKEVIPSTVVETLDLTLEIFNKCRLGQNILPLMSQQDFVLLYDGVSAAAAASRSHVANGHCQSHNKAEPRRYRSDSEGRSAAVAGRDCSKSSTTVRSPLHLNRVSVGESLDLQISSRTRAELKFKQNHLKVTKCFKVQQKTTLTDCSSVCSSPSKGVKHKKDAKRTKQKRN